MPIPFTLCLPLLLLLGPTREQDPIPAEPSETRIEDFDWLAGAWRGEGFGGVCEEVWSEPLAGTMMASFRLVMDNGEQEEVSFYELVVLGKDDDGWALKVKHFTKDFVAWETKKKCVRFALESVQPNEAIFSGLKFVRDGDKLNIKLRMRQSDGTTNWQSIRMHRHAK